MTFAAPVQRKKTALVTSSAKASDSEHNTSQLLDAEEAAKYDLAVSGRDVFSSSQLVSGHLQLYSCRAQSTSTVSATMHIAAVATSSF